MEQKDDYLVPLQDQRVFGAGIKRKRVTFVPATTASALTLSDSTSDNVRDRYLSIVLPRNLEEENRTSNIGVNKCSTDTTHSKVEPEAIVCDICHIVIKDDEESVSANGKSHETTIAHQYCLAHSHPPSHLDRNRKGLQYLSSYGWDPDGRVGLGARENGILAPIKVKIKNDTVGLGVKRMGTLEQERRTVNKEQRLDAKKVRKNEYDKRKIHQHLQDAFYRHEDLEKYLGEDH